MATHPAPPTGVPADQPPLADLHSRGARRARLSDRAATVVFATAAALSLAVIAGVVIFVLYQAWPSFKANGLAWFSVGDVPLAQQLDSAFQNNTTLMNAGAAVIGTILTTVGALILAFPIALLTSIFIAEIAPRRVAQAFDPVISLLAGTPSVVFGLFAILAIAPIIENHLISEQVAATYSPIVPLNGGGLLLGIIVLTIMIAPIMIAIFTDALNAVPQAWKEGALALGCDRWRMVRRVSLRAIRPALLAGTSLAIGRAVGEAIALSMATGQYAFVPNPLDGRYFFLEPVRVLSALIVDYSEGFGGGTISNDLFAFGAVLLVTTATLTIGAKIAARPFERRLAGDAD